MSRIASGNTFEVQSDLSRYLNGIVVAFEPDDDDDDDKGGDGAGGSDDANDDDDDAGQGDGSGASGASDIKDPDKKRLSDEAAAARVKAREEKRLREAAEAELRKLTDKDKSELEKAQRDLAELQQAVAKKDSIISEQGLKLAFYESGVASRFKDQKVARRLMDLSDLKPDEDGNYDEKAIKAKADALLKESPYLAADGSDDGAGEPPSGGSPNNGRRKNGKEADQAKLVKKFPALAGRTAS